MIKKLKNLTIGNSIFILTMVIVTSIILVSSLVTYRMIFSRTDNLIESTSKEINKQVVLNYENYLSNVIDTSNIMQKYIIELTRKDDIYDLNIVFGNTVELQKNIVTVALFSNLGNAVAISSPGQTASDIITKSWFYSAIKFRDIHHFSSPHIEDIFLNGTKEVFTISKSVQYYSGGLEKEGVLVINIDSSDFRALANMTNLGVDGRIVITDENDDLIYSSSSSCTSDSCESIDVIKDITLGGQLIKIDNLSMYVNVNTIKNTRWKIATFINVNEITNTKSDILLLMIVIFGITIITTSFTSAALSRTITNPINQLANHIKKIEKGDFDTTIKVEGQKEMVVFAEAFNKMSGRVKELMQKVLIEQTEKRKSHFVALQNQINPHFLYNALDSIIWLSENKRNEDVEKAIFALSKFFRMSISDEHSLVRLKDEIEHVKNYLLIQQLRYHNSFIFDFDIEDKTLNKYVLKLSIQPLVENAIIHGINPDEEFNHILISSCLKDDYIFIKVKNEGYGIDEKRIEEIYEIIKGDVESESVGLKNIYERLKLYFGEKAELIINSVLDEYTEITLKMPVVDGENL